MRIACAVMALLVLGASAPAHRNLFPVDRAAERWVDETMRRLTMAERIGQLVVPAFDANFVSTDSEVFDRLAELVRTYHVSGFHVFGGTDEQSRMLLNPTYGGVNTLGDALAAASLLDRLQAMASVPLMNTADFETGVGFRLAGATTFPREMAMGAVGDPRLVTEEARITGIESRAVGVQVVFAPVVDVNVNPRNPVINTRSYGEDPARVAELASAYLDGARDGGVIATVKHFPGHGDTDVDSHLGLPIIPHPLDRLKTVEFVPFRAAIDRGVPAVMAAHIVMPALDPSPETPATFSHPILTDLLRGEFGFRGLVYTDSMSMDAVAKMVPPGEAAVRAVLAGADVILHSPDPIAAIDGLRSAAASGRIPSSRIDESVRMILRAKASLGLHVSRTVDLQAVADNLGGRAHRAPAEEASRRSITLIKDAAGQVPLKVAKDQPVLYVQILDYPGSWRIATPGRTLVPELRQRWPNLTAIELSDHSAPADIDLVRSMAPRFRAIVVGVFVRASAGSGRLDLAEPLIALLHDLARRTDPSRALVACFFGNPYIAAAVPELPSMLLTYDFYDLAERSAARALAGEAPITGRLPVTLSPAFPAGSGIARP